MKAFLLAFDPSRTTRDMVIRHIDAIDFVENWYALFDSTILIAGSSTSKMISATFRQAFPDLKFIITEVDQNHKGGWLPRSVWSFLNDPRPAAAESA